MAEERQEGLFSPLPCFFRVEEGDEVKEQEQQQRRQQQCVLLIERLLEERWFWDNVVRCRPRTAPAAPSLAPTTSGEGSGNGIEMMVPVRPRRRSLLHHMEAQRRFGDMHIQVPELRLEDAARPDELSLLAEGEGEEEEEGRRQQQQQQLANGYHHRFPKEDLREGWVPAGSPGKQQQLADALLDSGQFATRAGGSRRRRRDRRRGSRSMTELEIDELRGCMDLGFRPTKGDSSPRVVSLSRTGDSSPRQRLYPSQGWLISRPDSPLLNWKMPGPDQQGVDMKKHLKFWVHAVASTVRQEC